MGIQAKRKKGKRSAAFSEFLAQTSLSALDVGAKI